MTEGGQTIFAVNEDTLIHIEGIPFWLPAGSEVVGNTANLKLISADLEPANE